MPRLWTLVASCPSLVKITIINGAPAEVIELDSDEHTYHPDVETDDGSSSDDVGLNCIRPTSSTYLSIVKCVPSPPAEKDDWRRTTTFHTFTKIGDKSCKVIWIVEVVSIQYCPSCVKILD